eukprot:SAG31_NODE_3176_length_4586_cov_2.717406_2_plen_53_part_00
MRAARPLPCARRSHSILLDSGLELEREQCVCILDAADRSVSSSSDASHDLNS